MSTDDGKGKDLMSLSRKLGVTTSTSTTPNDSSAVQPAIVDKSQSSSLQKKNRINTPMVGAASKGRRFSENNGAHATSSGTGGGSSGPVAAVTALTSAIAGASIGSSSSGGDDDKEITPSSRAAIKRKLEIRKMVDEIKSRNLNNGGGRQANGGPWMAKEDEELCDIVTRDQPNKWKAKAAELNKRMAPLYERLASGAAAKGEGVVEYGRVAAQCLHRWKKVLQPGLNKGHWTAEEDADVRQKVEESIRLGTTVKWSAVAMGIKGRLGKQCRERWFNHLDPSVKKTEWTSHEDEILFNAQIFFNTRWCEISKLLPGRTENAVKNRFNSSARRKWESSAAGATADRGSSRLFLEKLKRTLGDTEAPHKKRVLEGATQTLDSTVLPSSKPVKKKKKIRPTRSSHQPVTTATTAPFSATFPTRILTFDAGVLSPLKSAKKRQKKTRVARSTRTPVTTATTVLPSAIRSSRIPPVPATTTNTNAVTAIDEQTHERRTSVTVSGEVFEQDGGMDLGRVGPIIPKSHGTFSLQGFEDVEGMKCDKATTGVNAGNRLRGSVREQVTPRGKGHRQGGIVIDGAIGGEIKHLTNSTTPVVFQDNGGEFFPETGFGSGSKKSTAELGVAGKFRQEPRRVEGGSPAGDKVEGGKDKALLFANLALPVIVDGCNTSKQGAKAIEWPSYGGSDGGNDYGEHGKGSHVAVKGRATGIQRNADRATENIYISSVTGESGLGARGLKSSTSPSHCSPWPSQRKHVTCSYSQVSSTITAANGYVVSQRSQPLNNQDRESSVDVPDIAENTSVPTALTSSSSTDDTESTIDICMNENLVGDLSPSLVSCPPEMWTIKSAPTAHVVGVDPTLCGAAVGVVGPAQVPPVWSGAELSSIGMQELAQPPVETQSGAITQDLFSEMIAPSEHFDQPTNSIDGSKALAPAPGIIHDIGDEHCGGDGGEGGRDLVWSWPEVLSPPSGLPISPVGTFCDDSAHYDDDPGFMDIDSNACYNMFNNMNSATLVGEPPDIAADCVRAAAAANDEFDNELGLLSDRDSQSASKATAISPFELDT